MRKSRTCEVFVSNAILLFKFIRLGGRQADTKRRGYIILYVSFKVRDGASDISLLVQDVL